MDMRGDDDIFIEVTLIDGVNDNLEDARALIEFLKPFGKRAKVNLIPYNDTQVDGYRPAMMDNILKFQKVLREEGGWLTFIRTPRGHLQDAACGQLATSSAKKVRRGCEK